MKLKWILLGLLLSCNKNVQNTSEVEKSSSGLKVMGTQIVTIAGQGRDYSYFKSSDEGDKPLAHQRTCKIQNKTTVVIERLAYNASNAKYAFARLLQKVTGEGSLCAQNSVGYFFLGEVNIKDVPNPMISPSGNVPSPSPAASPSANIPNAFSYARHDDSISFIECDGSSFSLIGNEKRIDGAFSNHHMGGFQTCVHYESQASVQLKLKSGALCKDGQEMPSTEMASANGISSQPNASCSFKFDTLTLDSQGQMFFNAGGISFALPKKCRINLRVLSRC